jgi:predicted nucleotidyltransferase
MQINDEILLIKDTILNTTECEKIYLFGSFAYGVPHKDSDYDFWVVLKDSPKHPIYTVQEIHRKLARIKNINKPCDVLASYKSRFEERKNLPTLERKIAKEGFLLYERD